MKSYLLNKSLKKIISKILKIPVGRINNNTGPKNLEKWDSINNIKILLEIEQKYKIKLNEKDFFLNKNFKSLTNFVKKKVANEN